MVLRSSAGRASSKFFSSASARSRGPAGAVIVNLDQVPGDGSKAVDPDTQSSSTAPAVSVIIPVRNRRDLLLETLAALDAQTYRDFEVIVADDGSTDGSREAAEASTIAGRPVRVLQSPGRGAVAARRDACDRALAPLLAFTDSDCRPSPTWLSSLVAAAAAGADLISGPTLAQRDPKPLERTMVSPGDDGGYPTCNVMYRRELYDKAGGFVTVPDHPLTGIATTSSLNAGFWEDTLMGWRLRRIGATTAFAPNAVVHHSVFPPDVPDLMRRTWSIHVAPAVLDLVPEMADSHLRHHLVRNCREAGLLPLITTAALVRRRRLAAALVGVWAAARIRTHARNHVSARDIARALPIEFAVDAVRMAAVVRGQVRARRFVL